MLDFIRTLTKYLKRKLDEDLQNLEQRGQKKLLETIGSIEQGSSRITTWSLSVIGGSLIVFMNGEYVQPKEEYFKYSYLLFVIGWILLAISISYSKRITGRKMAATLNVNDIKDLKKILIKVNIQYSNQILCFNWALVIYGLWLILYFVWRLFGEQLKCLIH
ncbi:hypothetical protein [Ekhidna sp. To15]|uniref:hypothetical protein n=1 Tax=Ekhidna sp. To15 TaxID=3395267 RepID=UPI003F521C48